MKITSVMLLILLALIVGGLLERYLTPKTGQDTEFYNAVLIQLPKKDCSLELLRKQIILNKAQGMILDSIYQDELKREIKKTGGK